MRKRKHHLMHSRLLMGGKGMKTFTFTDMSYMVRNFNEQFFK